MKALRTMRAWFVRLSLVLAVCGASAASAQELLVNRSFESPVVANGDNPSTTLPNWTVVNVTPPQALPFNLVRPWIGYLGQATTTPTGGGAQYLDINNASGNVRQTVTIPSQGMIDFSAWFSVRDSSRVLTGTVNILDSGGAVVGTASIGFMVIDPIGTWKQAASANLPVSAGTYTIDLVVDNYANTDLASLVFKPGLAVTKTAAAYSDPVNGSVNPKQIPGGVTEYTILTSTPSSYSVTSNSIVVADPTPANLELVVTDIGTVGSGPVAFVAGSTGLTYTYASLASTTDNLDFSNNNGTSWTYSPVADADGADPLVTNVRMRPQGTMAASSTLTFRLRYRVK